MKSRFNLALMTAIMALSLVATSVLAWFYSEAIYAPTVDGETNEFYFHRGDGSLERPFTITTPVHLYNLAKLQEAGAFGTTKYYFQVGIETINGQIVETPSYTEDEDGNIIPGNDYEYLVYSASDISANRAPTSKVLDMGTLSKNGENFIVPIGGSLISNTTTASQFIGIFSGNELTIANLYVKANESFCHVGMFGAIGEGALVQDFILDSPVVETTGTNPASISFAELPTSSADFEHYAGILAGYANGGLFNIGVYKGDFRLSNLNYASKFSWLGYATKNIKNFSDAAGNILDYIIDWNLIKQRSGSSSNLVFATIGDKLSDRTDLYGTGDNVAYNKEVFEVVAPFEFIKYQHVNWTTATGHYFPYVDYTKGVASKINQMKDPLTKTIIQYNNTATQNVFFLSLRSVVNDSLQQGLKYGNSGVTFKTEGAGYLLLMCGSVSTYQIGIYKKANDIATDKTFLPYLADWTIGSSSNTANWASSTYTKSYNGSSFQALGSNHVTVVIKVKEAGTYIVGAQNASTTEKCGLVFDYTRFIIDSEYGNVSGDQEQGDSKSILSVDFSYKLSGAIQFPSFEEYVYSQINVFFPNSTLGVSAPINIYYRRDYDAGSIIFDIWYPGDYVSEMGVGSLNLLPLPPV